MVNRPKAIGTAGESAVVAFLRANGFATAERRALAGAHDLGDILTPGLCWEVKAGTAAVGASATKIDKWMAETFHEMQNADADYGLLVTKRYLYGPDRAWGWWVYLDSATYAALTGGPLTMKTAGGTVRITLAEAVALLRYAGYGDEPTAVVA